MATLTELFSMHNSVLVVIPPEKYNTTITELLLELNQLSKRTGYINMNRLITKVRKALEQNGMDLNKYHFVDAVTKSVIPNPELYTNCLYIPSPNDLTKLSIGITKMLRNAGPDYVLFDSVSSLLIYESLELSNQFLHSLANKLNAFGTKSLYTCLQGEEEEKVIRSLSLVIEKVERL